MHYLIYIYIYVQTYVCVYMCLKQVKSVGKKPLWDVYLSEGLNKIREQKTDNESDFNRPPAESDKLQMYVGGTELIEITHPISKQKHGTGYV